MGCKNNIRYGATMEQIQYELLGRIVVDARGCFNWKGWKCKKGYGTVVVNGKMKKAHRVSYAVFRREIPDGLFVCHKCDNPSCINPAHLFLGTQLDNMRDCKAKGRNPFGETVARHRLTEEQVKDIRRRDWLGETHSSIAKLYGVGRPHVSGICSGRYWRHLK